MIFSIQLLQGFDMGLLRPPIVFYAFDLLRLNGEDLRSWPIEERKAKLAALLKRPPARSRSKLVHFSTGLHPFGRREERAQGMDWVVPRHHLKAY